MKQFFKLNLRKGIFFGLLIFIFASCGVSINSIVKPGLEKSYKNPLIAIEINNHSRNFAKNLKKRLQQTFLEHDKKIEVLLVPAQGSANLSFEENEIQAEKMIEDEIKKGNRDLLIYFRHTDIHLVDGILRSLKYFLISFDTESSEEVWKAKIEVAGYFGPSSFGQVSFQKNLSKIG